MNHKYPVMEALEIASPDMLADALLTGEPYPIKACWIQSTNTFVNMGADSKKVLKALQCAEFCVVVDLFMTPTALAVADIMLPAACFAECIGLSGHHPYYLGAIVKAIEPLENQNLINKLFMK